MKFNMVCIKFDQKNKKNLKNGAARSAFLATPWLLVVVSGYKFPIVYMKIGWQ